MATIIGRKKEIDELMRIYRSPQAQFVAVYGRRRVGKTYLVRELFKNEFAFYFTGISPVELKGKSLLSAQLTAFASALQLYGYDGEAVPQSWLQAFDMLIKLLMQKPKDRRMVVFIDEMPWLDTPRSGFVSAFEHFWNGWGAGQENLMLIVCGSASSWIKENLINSYGGLYNRVTSEIRLAPFSLAESEELLTSMGVTMSRYDILQLYMALGGIPMYLSYVIPGRSLAQTIDALFFERNAKLKLEYSRMFRSIFNGVELYQQVVDLLAKHHGGLTREEIMTALGITSGNRITNLLRTLEASDFIEAYKPFERTTRCRVYRLIDPFCIFFKAMVEGKRRTENYWRENESRGALNVWRGCAFENAALLHVKQILRAMGVDGVSHEAAPWVIKPTDASRGMQLDLVIVRNDRVVNVCEMKFLSTQFTVTADYEQVLRARQAFVSEHFAPRYNVQMTLVSALGLAFGKHCGVFQNSVTIDDLFT
ncbi:MAG: ATP-binding protein [Muribaculaceae bacterium]